MTASTKRAGTRTKLVNRLEMVRQLRAEKSAIENQIKELQGEALTFITDLGQKSFQYEAPDGIQVTGTRVAPERETINESRLKKALGVKGWNRVTRRVLDKSSLEEAMLTGHVDPLAVADCTESTPSNPYFKLTERTPKADE